MTRAFVNGQKRARSKTQQLLHILKMAGWPAQGAAAANRPGEIKLRRCRSPRPDIRLLRLSDVVAMALCETGGFAGFLAWPRVLLFGDSITQVPPRGPSGAQTQLGPQGLRPLGRPWRRRCRGPGGLAAPPAPGCSPRAPRGTRWSRPLFPSAWGGGSVRTPAAPRRGSRSLQRRRSPSARRWGILRGVRGRPGASRGALAPSQCLPCRWRRFSTERASVAQGAVSPRGPRAAHTGTRFALCSLWWAGLISNKMSPFIRNHFNSH